MQVQIRKMIVEDAEPVSFLTRQLGYQISVSETVNNIKQAIGTNDHLLLVATHDSKVIGWIHAFKALYIESKSFIEIGGLVADENYRGNGIGTALINEVKQWCRTNGILQLRLRTNVKRTEAHEFYRKAGFIEMKQQIVFAMQVTAEEK